MFYKNIIYNKLIIYLLFIIKIFYFVGYINIYNRLIKYYYNYILLYSHKHTKDKFIYLSMYYLPLSTQYKLLNIS